MFWVRRVLIALGVLALVAGLGVGALILLVDPNDYKVELEQAVKERYDRTLVIDGDIRLSFLPRLGLEISGVSLSEPGSNQVFAVVDSAHAAVAWTPLFARHLVVEHLTVTGVKANVVRGTDGRFNFDDLMHAPAPAVESDAHEVADRSRASLQLDVDGVTVNGGDVALRDDVHDMALRVERLSLSAGGVATGAPFEFSVTARLLGQSPRVDANLQAQGRLLVDPATQRFGVRAMDLRMTGTLPSVRATSFGARGDLAWDAEAGALDVTGLSVGFQGDVALATPLTGVDAQLTVSRLALDRQGRVQVAGVAGKAQGRMDAAPFSATLEVPSLDITETSAGGDPLQAAFSQEGDAATKFSLALSGIGGSRRALTIDTVDVQASVRRAARTASLEASSSMTANVPERTLSMPDIDGTADIDDPARDGGALSIPLTASFEGDWAQGVAHARFDAALPEGRFEAEAGLTRGREAVPALRFAVSADVLDVDDWWPPAQPPAKAASAPARNGGETLPATERVLIDYAPLTRLDADGTLRIGRLVVGGVEARNLTAALALAAGRAEISDVAAETFEGRLEAGGFADAGKQRIGLQARLSDVAVQPLLAAAVGFDALSGRGDVLLDLSAGGRLPTAVRRSLEGHATVHLRDGAFEGINVAQTLRDFRELLGRGEPRSEPIDRARATDFSELRGRLALDAGVGTLEELFVTAPLLRITQGSPATVDFAEERLDLVLETRVVNTSTGQGGKALERLHGVTIPIHFSGPLAAPEYTVQWHHVGSRELARILENEASRQIGRLLDRATGNRDGEGSTENDESPANAASKRLGNALKGLFTP